VIPEAIMAVSVRFSGESRLGFLMCDSNNFQCNFWWFVSNFQ
jgi:hypothetical protein